MRCVNKLTLFLMAGFFGSPTFSTACECEENAFDLNQLFMKSDVVIVAQATTAMQQIELNGFNYLSTDFSILEIFKDDKIIISSGIVKIITTINTCGVEFKTESTYIIHANFVKNIGYITGLCSAPARVENNQGHYRYLKRLLSDKNPIYCAEDAILSNYSSKSNDFPSIRCWHLKEGKWIGREIRMGETGQLVGQDYNE